MSTFGVAVALCLLAVVLSSPSAAPGVAATRATNTSCGEGWTPFGDECYKHFPILAHKTNETTPTPVTFEDAVAFCEHEQATIGVIHSQSQMSFMIGLVGRNSGRKFWNGVYQDKRFKTLAQVWRTVYNRTFYDGVVEFFAWDRKRGMPRHEDCIVVHVRGDLGKRIVGGNDLMLTYACDQRAEVVCERRRVPWSVTAVNMTTAGSLLHIEGRPLTLAVVGRNLPVGMSVQLQTTTYKTHPTLEGEPTHCTQTGIRDPIPFNVSAPGTALNVTRSRSPHPACNASCDQVLIHFPTTLKLVRGHKYSLCFFMPYNYRTPKTQNEYRWDYLPGMWLEVAETRMNFLRETCQRHRDLVNVLYFDRTATDLTRVVPSPMYFDGPVHKDGYEYKEGFPK